MRGEGEGGGIYSDRCCDGSFCLFYGNFPRGRIMKLDYYRRAVSERAEIDRKKRRQGKLKITTEARTNVFAIITAKTQSGERARCVKPSSFNIRFFAHLIREREIRAGVNAMRVKSKKARLRGGAGFKFRRRGKRADAEIPRNGDA